LSRCLTWLALLLGLVSTGTQAGSVTVDHLRLWHAPDNTRLVFDVSAPLSHRLFTLRNPDRLVIDIDNARLKTTLPEVSDPGPWLAGIRSGMFDQHTLRIVLDLKSAVRPRTFLLKPAGDYGHRLVIDLYGIESIVGPNVVLPESKPSHRDVKRDLVVAIDPGHGGEDPGAIGRRYRTKEKVVTLAVARELKQLIDATPGMSAVLVRDGDYYVKLTHRYIKANELGADLFISIHADALPGRRSAYGSSVYALSEKGASDQLTSLLANRENAADLIGGVDLRDKDADVMMVLMDLAHTKTLEYSLLLGKDILGGLRKAGPIHYLEVRQAGFRVLKHPEIPSILVETAFISTPSEEKKLRTKSFQRKLASGILDGIKRYKSRPNIQPLRTPMVAGKGNLRPHVVRKGETLTSIANKYNVNIDNLRFANNLGNDVLRAGSTLYIP
jgi:N-acetylmuramoyl-L-alanine amidase